MSKEKKRKKKIISNEAFQDSNKNALEWEIYIFSCCCSFYSVCFAVQQSTRESRYITKSHDDDILLSRFVVSRFYIEINILKSLISSMKKHFKIESARQENYLSSFSFSALTLSSRASWERRKKEENLLQIVWKPTKFMISFV